MLAQPDKHQLIEECYYDEPRDAAAARYMSSEEWQAVRELLPVTRGRALDVGAGHGISTYALAMEGWRVTAVEPDASALVGRLAIEHLARVAGLSVQIASGGGEELPFGDGEFDLVFCRQVMHHAVDLERFCREVHRVLRPGGTFVAIRDHVVSSPQQLEQFRHAHPLHWLYGGENAFSVARYRRALQTARMNLVRELGPFDSPINYAPQTRLSLRNELIRRAGHVYGGAAIMRWLITSDWRFDQFLKLLSRIDRRPGRLYSFVSVRS